MLRRLTVRSEKADWAVIYKTRVPTRTSEAAVAAATTVAAARHGTQAAAVDRPLFPVCPDVTPLRKRALLQVRLRLRVRPITIRATFSPIVLRQKA